MSDETETSKPDGPSRTGDGSTPSPGPKVNDLDVLGGGRKITVTKVDGTAEEVFVRQLPYSRIPEWGDLHSPYNAAGIVDLVCGKEDRNAIWNLRNLHAIETRLLELMRGAVFEQIPEIEKRLNKAREEIGALAGRQSWSDSLTSESFEAVIELQEAFNRPRFARWSEMSMKAIGQRAKEAAAAAASRMGNSASTSRESKDSTNPVT